MNVDEGLVPTRREETQRLGPSRGRIVAVDALRGLAIGGMVVYHAVWDLHAFGLSSLDPRNTVGLRWLGHGVAAAFLLLSGLGLRLAERDGWSGRRALMRIAALALAAGGVTLATWAVAPEAAVSFGILHCMAVSNAVGLALRRCGNGVLVATAAICALLPFVWPWPFGPALAWLGLSANVPPALDFRPVLPWIACVLGGMVVGRTALVSWLANIPARNEMAVFAAAAGRHSLAIYLVHQPVMIGATMAFALAVGVTSGPVQLSTPTEAAAFIAECTRSCRDAGSDDTLCRSTCHCVLTATVRSARPGLIGRLQPPQSGLRQAVETCRPPSAPAMPDR